MNGPWPDAEAALVAWLPGLLGGVRVSTDTPADLEGALPMVRLYRSGGTDDGFRLDTAVVEVDTFAATRPETAALAARVRALLLQTMPGTSITSAAGAVVVTACSTMAAPAVRPWSTTVVRIGATYAVRLHTR